MLPDDEFWKKVHFTVFKISVKMQIWWSNPYKMWYFGLIVFCARCANCALDVSMRNICARFSPNAQYMRKICARLYFFPDAQYMRKICTRLYFFLQCARFAQDCTYFSNAQYMRKICARLYFLQCAIYAQDLHKICTRLYFFRQCARFAQDCTYFLNAQYMDKICARLYLTSNLKW